MTGIEKVFCKIENLIVSYSPCIDILFYWFCILLAFIFWKVDPLLGNNYEISNYKTAVSK
jgi:hypothetical protein